MPYCINFKRNKQNGATLRNECSHWRINIFHFHCFDNSLYAATFYMIILCVVSERLKGLFFRICGRPVKITVICPCTGIQVRLSRKDKCKQNSVGVGRGSYAWQIGLWRELGRRPGLKESLTLRVILSWKQEAPTRFFWDQKWRTMHRWLAFIPPSLHLWKYMVWAHHGYIMQR